MKTFLTIGHSWDGPVVAVAIFALLGLLVVEKLQSQKALQKERRARQALVNELEKARNRSQNQDERNACENEWLKSEIERLRTATAEIYRLRAQGAELIRLRSESQQRQREISQLRSENERLNSLQAETGKAQEKLIANEAELLRQQGVNKLLMELAKRPNGLQKTLECEIGAYTIRAREIAVADDGAFILTDAPFLVRPESSVENGELHTHGAVERDDP